MQPVVDPSMPGQVSPHSLSRGSSTSSLTQQAPQWKEDDRMMSSVPPSAANPPVARAYSGGRGMYGCAFFRLRLFCGMI